MIAVTGATGQLGRLVINALLKKVPASEIIAAVRSPEKASDLAALGVQVLKADYSQPATLETAFQGVDKLLLISSSEVGQRIAQHTAVINAAKKAGVKLLAYTSLLHADKSTLGLGEEHRATEELLRDSGLPVVLLRNGWYTENYAASIAPALAHGAFIGAVADGRIASAAREDYAEAAATVLTQENQAGKVYELAGDDSYTLAEFTAEIARQSGKPVVYKNLSETDFKQALIGAGLPDGFASLLTDSDAGAAKGGLFDDSHTLSKLIGRPTTPYAKVIAATLATL
ncbi:3-beta hydroxysteroid dehydrogenase/isomerase family protein [Yersinia rochesterensis]|uniref:3-beta hydroxysteroid dehydrogenase/isomerase family protein n=1 Tax=Yersinia rochesterensis TaxID=1604335 RepID=A0A386HFN5_9GAMM|nr:MULTISPECIES: SDR family oxidoreductase [Yersinia]AJI88035.1 3-beta hydroxysteroid dehydrogenase/isomerase family protein [Yersinia frederiksenii Y225]CNG76011.1 nadph:quinone oxidoreductase 2 [Yersinia kristensenii]AIN18687.1 3-beta hydroxysteroid dehydrogenase/isomerase family protein [Yersinia rochesterensis]AJJ37929.1 3-beta hydroxysteroid dehydrogenase/isomerase family protein [Yersinia rochesterensis]AYD44341.1 SDR family oxidoreductase [Yersinia rochesterensis]